MTRFDRGTGPEHHDYRIPREPDDGGAALPADLQALIARRDGVRAYFQRRAREEAEVVAGFMDAIGYTADDLAADLDEGGSIEITPVRADWDGGWS
jgi:hypothetical protein